MDEPESDSTPDTGADAGSDAHDPDDGPDSLSGSYTGVIDRFEEDLAVVVLEKDGETVGEHVTSIGNLPEEGRTVDAVLTVTLSEGDLVNAEYDPDATEQRSSTTQSRFDRLARRPPSSDEDSESESS